MKTIPRLLTLAAMLATAQLAPAAAPSAVNYQGRFTNAAGVPQPGIKTMSLRIYDAATGGIQLYSETVGNVTVDANGVYGFQFGVSGAGIPASLATALAVSAEQWLELTVDGLAQAPRQKILAVPFALMAGGLPDGAVSTAMIADGAVGLSKITGLGTAATAASTDFAPMVIPGPFSDDLSAIRGGVAINSGYRKSDKSVVWRDSVTEQIALMGDSITSMGSGGTSSMSAIGYGSWARVFSMTQWDAAINGAVLEFATGGYSSENVRVTHLPEVLASNATRCVVACGINDYAAGYTSEQTATRLRGMWTSLATAGITPIATTITPTATTALRQVWIAATNILIRAHAASDGVTLCDWSSVLEVSPGVGSVATLPDNVHPNDLGACKMGRVLAQSISTLTMDTRDNYLNTAWLTTNPEFAGSSGQPTGWAVPSIAANATLNAKSLEASAEGNWWRIDYTNGAATSRSTLSNMTANTSTVVGKTVEAIVELQVISGGLRGFQLRHVTSGGTQEGYDLQVGNNVSAEDLITSADGIVILRTPPTVVSGGVTLLWPQMTFSGTAVFQIRRCGIRDVTP